MKQEDKTIHAQASEHLEACIAAMNALSEAIKNDQAVKPLGIVEIPMRATPKAEKTITVIPHTLKGHKLECIRQTLTNTHRTKNQTGRVTLRATGIVVVSEDTIEIAKKANKAKAQYITFIDENMSEDKHPGSRRRFNRKQKQLVPLQVTRLITIIEDTHNIEKIEHSWQTSHSVIIKSSSEVTDLILKMANRYLDTPITDPRDMPDQKEGTLIHTLKTAWVKMQAPPSDLQYAEYRPKTPYPRACMTYKDTTSNEQALLHGTPMPILIPFGSHEPKIVLLKDYHHKSNSTRNRETLIDVGNPFIKVLNIYLYKDKRKYKKTPKK